MYVKQNVEDDMTDKITVQWYKDSHRIIHFDFPIKWTWDEFWAAKQVSDEMMDGVNEPCAVILQAPPNVVLPDNALSNGRSMINKRHPRAGIFIIVTPNAFVRSVVKMLSQLYVARRGFLRSAGTMGEAENALIAAGFSIPQDADALPQMPG